MGQKLFRSLVPDRRSRSARSTESSAPAMADTLPAASAAAQAGETSKPSEPGTSKAAEARPAGSAGGRRIVCGIDGSEGSLAAFRFLKDTLVNPERGDRVTLVRAMEPLNPDQEGLYSEEQRRILEEGEEERRREARQELQQLAETAGVPCDWTIIDGDPRDAIQEYVATHPVDMLVVGNRGLSAVARLFLGSVGTHLVTNSPVPVTVVPPPEPATM